MPGVQMAGTDKHFPATITAAQKFVPFAVLNAIEPIDVPPQGAAHNYKLSKPHPRQNGSAWALAARFRRGQGGNLGPCFGDRM